MTGLHESASAEYIVAAEKHAFIEASAGSGKTTCLVDLICEIIDQGRAEIHEILCVTFTEKAASELKAKVFAQLSAGSSERRRTATEKFALNHIGTIHSFCLGGLNENKRTALGEKNDVPVSDDTIFDEAREWVYREVWSSFASARLSEYLTELNFGSGGNERQFDNELEKKSLHCFATGETNIYPHITVADEIRSAIDFKAFTLFKIIEKMHELATAKNVMTFSRMITAFRDALGEKAFAEQIRSLYRYALIDEFQDTDEAQWQIFRILFLSENKSQSGVKLIVVGDPKQAIYKFRGADVFVYIKAREEFGNHAAVFASLPVNYRSTAEILHVLDSIFVTERATAIWKAAGIQYAIPKHGKKSSDTGIDTGAEFYTSAKYGKGQRAAYYETAVHRVAEMRAQNPAWTIAVIAFKHQALKDMAEIFREKKIEFAYYKQKADFERIEIEHLRIFLESFTLPFGEGFILAQTTIFLKREPQSESYYKNLAGYLEQGKIINFIQILAQNQNPLHLLLEYSGDTIIYHNWRLFFQTLIQLCGKKIADLQSLRETLHEFSATGADEEQARADMLRGDGAITLLTVQSAKGLDWDAVVIADGINDFKWNDFSFFHNRSHEAVVVVDTDLFDASGDKLMSTDEEARITQLNLLYVAMTRARYKLIASISPPYRPTAPGPVSYFLNDWVLSYAAKKSGAVFYEIPDFLQPTARLPATQTRTRSELVPVNHGNIAERVSERTSFTALTHSEFSETDFIADVLPRGSETGQLLHTILENCNFSDLTGGANANNKKLREEISAVVEHQYGDRPDEMASIANRIFEIVHACATAHLPLTKQDGRGIALAGLPPGNLWREMPFWSAAATHKVLRDQQNGVLRRSMHGFMDLVFTPDGQNYYILDYKSNSLSEVHPDKINEYTRDHYGLQAEIYAEALNAYLTKNYSGAKTVAGCYFLFLRYLKSGESTGVHFMDFTRG